MIRSLCQCSSCTTPQALLDRVVKFDNILRKNIGNTFGNRDIIIKVAIDSEVVFFLFTPQIRERSPILHGMRRSTTNYVTLGIMLGKSCF